MKWNEQLRQERKSRGWAQGWVAKEIGTTTDTVNRWENGKTFPSPFYQQQLSQLFGKSLEELGLFRFLPEDENGRSKGAGFASKEEHVNSNYNAGKAILTAIGEEDDDAHLFVENENKSSEQSRLASEEEYVDNNQGASNDAGLPEREPECYTSHQTVGDDTSVQSQAPPAQQGLASSPVSKVQHYEPNTEALGDHPLSDQPLWELHIRMRGLPVLRPFRRVSSRSLLVLSTILLTALITAALLSIFNRQTLPTSSSHNPQESINNMVQGTGINQFNYMGGSWEHRASDDNTVCGYTPILNNNTVSWDNTPNDYVTLTFTGVQIAFYGMVAPSFGIGAVSIDGGDETMIDFYAADAESNQLLWTSSKLSAGTHTFKLRVTGNKNPKSFDSYVSVNRVDITH